MSRNIKVEIDHIGAQGDGVALVDGAPLYIPFSATGDMLEVQLKANDKSAAIVQIITPGPDRQSPPCPQYGVCGGCALQHINAKAYATWKVRLIREALGHRGFTDVVVAEPVISAPFSRRRAQFHCLSLGKAGVLIGFYERGSNRISKINGCQVLVPQITDFLGPLEAFLARLLSQGQKAAVQVTAASNGLDVWVDSPKALDLKWRMLAAEFAVAGDLARLTWGPVKEIVAERRRPFVKIDGIAAAMPPAAFLQATEAGQEALVGLAKTALAGARRVADLFSGLGTFALSLAQTARVHAVEGDIELITALKQAAGNSPGLQPVTVEKRDLYRRPLLPSELNAFDAVLFDPPRAGAKEQATQMASSKVPVIVAVSCNPATFARDARILVDGGYRIGEITPVDQFLWADHVELITVFRRG